MKSSHFIIFALLAALAIAASSYWLYQPQQQATGEVGTTSSTIEPWPEFSLADLKGQVHHHSEWQGQVVVVNFWATWCPPCIEEIPIFIELQQKYGHQGVQFIGIAIDSLEKVKAFAQRLEINYPLLVDEEQAIDIAIQFGNHMGALPFTVFVNRQGNMVVQHPGALKRRKAEQLILSLL